MKCNTLITAGNLYLSGREGDIIRSLSKRKKVLLCILLVGVISLMIAAFDNGLTVTEYTLYSDKINNAVRIVLLTDLHSCAYGNSQQELIERIDEQSPDIILMAGDIADDVLPVGRMLQLLEGIADRYPCYYVTGNHEFRSGEVDEMKDIFRTYAVTVLEGDCKELFINGQYLLICGVDDPEVGEEIFDGQLRHLSGLINPDKYVILLSHRPERFNIYAKYGYDLVLSGHAHGGQWRIPLILPQGLLAPNQGLFPKYTTGIHGNNNTKLIISRGLARESTRILRIFNPPELVVINLVPNPAI